MHYVEIGNVEFSERRPGIIATIESFAEAREAHRQGADITEVRLDLLNVKGYSLNRMISLCEKAREKTPVLATIRREQDGGKTKTDENRYLSFTNILPHVDAVDIEINSKICDEILTEAKKARVATFLSYHDMQKTPYFRDIAKRVIGMDQKNCSVIKIACMTQGSRDYMCLETLTDLSETTKHPLAIIPMGKLGEPGRKTFIWKGSSFMYGCVREPKAPGQVKIKELAVYRDACRK